MPSRYHFPVFYLSLVLLKSHVCVSHLNICFFLWQLLRVFCSFTLIQRAWTLIFYSSFSGFVELLELCVDDFFQLRDIFSYQFFKYSLLKTSFPSKNRLVLHTLSSVSLFYFLKTLVAQNSHFIIHDNFVKSGILAGLG